MSQGSDMASVLCPKCGKGFPVSRQEHGKVVQCPTCRSPVRVKLKDAGKPPGDDPLVGKVIGGCRIVSVLGRGGMGCVFKAEHTRLQRLVALKVMLPGMLENDAAVERFVREARVAAQLEHPNVVQVYDVGKEGEHHYISMQFVDGTSAKDLIERKGKLPPAEALDLVGQALQGMRAAHRKGMVHRDIKPANLLVTKDGILKISDFGLAKATSSTSQLTHSGAVMGTPHYMSPEQCESKPVDIRSDIYSLGVSLFEMVTGRRPYEGDTPLSVLFKHVQAPVPDLHEQDSSIPEPLAAIVARMMAKDPAARYQSPEEVIQAIDAARAGVAAVSIAASPAPAPPASAPSPKSVPSQTAPTVPDASRRMRGTRRGARVVPIVASVALGAILLGAGAYGVIRARRAPAKAIPPSPPSTSIAPPTTQAPSTSSTTTVKPAPPNNTWGKGVHDAIRTRNPGYKDNAQFEYEGGKIVGIDLSGRGVNDLTPISGMPLSRLKCNGNEIVDLSPLKGMPLKLLWVANTKASDLSPLKGMPLEDLDCRTPGVTDISPLAGMPLKRLRFNPNGIEKGMETVRSLSSLEQVGQNDPLVTPAAFWADWDRMTGKTPLTEAAIFSTPLPTSRSFFPLTMYLGVSLPQHIQKDDTEAVAGFYRPIVKRIRDLGFNTIMFVAPDGTGITLLELTKEANLKAMVYSMALASILSGQARMADTAIAAEVKRVASTMRRYDHIIAYELYADPVQPSWVNAWKAMGPVLDAETGGLPALVCYPDAWELKRFHEASPLRGYQYFCYPFATGNPRPLEGRIFSAPDPDQARRVLPRVPAWPWLQGMEADGIVMPTSVQLQAISYLCLAHGAPGLIYYLYVPPSKDYRGLCDQEYQPIPTLRDLSQALPTIRKMGETLVDCDIVDGVVMASPGVDANYFTDGKDKRYLMAASRNSEKPVRTTLNLDPRRLAQSSLKDILTGEAVPCRQTANGVQAEFEIPAASGRLFQVLGGQATPAPSGTAPGPMTPDQLHAALKAANPDYNGKGQFKVQDGEIVEVSINDCGISSLAPLSGMKLQVLWCKSNSNVDDLSPLKGMPLKRLGITWTQVRDLSPLQGMPLEDLDILRTEVKDVTVLVGSPLKRLWFCPYDVRNGLDVIRNMKSIEKIGRRDPLLPAAQFWDAWDRMPGKVPLTEAEVFSTPIPASRSFFPLTMYLAVPLAESIDRNDARAVAGFYRPIVQAIRDLDFNTLMFIAPEPPGPTLLDLTQELGMKAIVYPMATVPLLTGKRQMPPDEMKAEVRRVIGQVRKYPHVVGYELYADPLHPSWIEAWKTMGPIFDVETGGMPVLACYWDAWDIKEFHDASHLRGYQYFAYPFKAGVREPLAGRIFAAPNPDQARRVLPRVPAWPWLQGMEGQGVVMPTGPQLQAISYLCLAHGAPGLVYYYYGPPATGYRGLCDEKYQPIQTLRDLSPALPTIRKMGETLVDCDIVDGVVTASPGVDANYFTDGKDKRYLMAASRNTEKPVRTTVTLDPRRLAQSSLKDILSGETVPCRQTANGVQAEFEIPAASGRLFQIIGPSGAPAPGAK